MKKILLLVLLITSTVFANSQISILKDELYFLPKQNSEIKEEIIELIKNSKDEITIAMYNFSYKKFAKELIEVSNNGVDVTVILDEKKLDKDDDIYKLFKKSKVKTTIIKDKMHLKAAIFDNKVAIIGSSNWTKESFEENYEIVYKLHDKEAISRLSEELKELIKKGK